MTIYLVIKCAKSVHGGDPAVATEAAFKDQAKAEQFVAGKPAVWNETIAGIEFYCERAIHVIDVTE